MSNTNRNRHISRCFTFLHFCLTCKNQIDRIPMKRVLITYEITYWEFSELCVNCFPDYFDQRNTWLIHKNNVMWHFLERESLQQPPAVEIWPSDRRRQLLWPQFGHQQWSWPRGQRQEDQDHEVTQLESYHHKLKTTNSRDEKYWRALKNYKKESAIWCRKSLPRRALKNERMSTDIIFSMKLFLDISIFFII